MKTIKKLVISKTQIKTLTPRAYFEIENKHLFEQGLKKHPNGGIGCDLKGHRLFRIYPSDKEVSTVKKDIKALKIQIAIELPNTIIAVVPDSLFNIMYNYLKGLKIECQHG